jgi:hypothetical protein
MMGTLEKLSHAELTNTPPNTAHARVAAIQHNLQLHVESHVQSSRRLPTTGLFYIHLLLVAYVYLPRRGNSALVQILATSPFATDCR